MKRHNLNVLIRAALRRKKDIAVNRNLYLRYGARSAEIVNDYQEYEAIVVAVAEALAEIDISKERKHERGVDSKA